MDREKFDPRYLRSDPQKKHMSPPPPQRRSKGGGSTASESENFQESARQSPRKCDFSSDSRRSGQEQGYRADKDISEEICATLANDGSIDASDIEIEVTEGTVILTGEVPSEYSRLAVEKLVSRVMDVRDVKNYLLIEGSGPQGGGQSSSQHGIKKRLNI